MKYRSLLTCIIFILVVMSVRCAPTSAGTIVTAANAYDAVYDSQHDTVYVSNKDNVVRYEVKAATYLSAVSFQGSTLEGIDLSPDDSTVAISDSTTAADGLAQFHLIDTVSRTVTTVEIARQANDFNSCQTHNVAWADDGTLFVSVSSTGGDGGIYVYSPAAKACTNLVWDGPFEYGLTLVASADRASIACCPDHASSDLDIFRTVDHTYTSMANAAPQFPRSVAISRDGKQVGISCCPQLKISFPPTLYMYNSDFTGMYSIAGTSGTTDGPVGFVYSTNANRLYTSWSTDSSVRAYDTNTHALVQAYNLTSQIMSENDTEPSFGNGSLRISKDGSMLMVIGWTGQYVLVPCVELVPLTNSTLRLDSLSQRSVMTGSSAITLTVNGNGFAQGNSLYWDGTALVTTYNSSTQLSATVPGTLLSSSTSAEITVVSATGNSNPLRFYVTPLTPSNLVAVGASTSSGSSISLTWTSSPGATSYDVYRGSSAGAEGTTPYATVTSASYLDNNSLIRPGQTYYYKVAARSPGGYSQMSTEASATTPPQPMALQAVANNAAVTLNITCNGATSFDIYRSTTSNGEGSTPYVTINPADFWIDNNVSNGTTYYYKVIASNAAGSVTSAEVSATPLSTKPVPPTLTGSQSLGSIQLTWTSVPSATSYSLYVLGGVGQHYALQASGLTGTSYVYPPSGFFGSIIGQTYSFYVLAFGSNGISAPSNVVTVTVVPATTPPSTVHATPTDAEVDLTWTPSSGATSYNIYRGTSSGGESSSPVATNVQTAVFNDTQLVNGTTYYYQVTAVNAYGETAKSSEVNATPMAPTVVFLRSDTTTQGNWNGVYGADGFNVVDDPSPNNPSNPTYAVISPSGNDSEIWATSTSSATALQKAAVGSTDRIAACWYNPSSFTVDLNETDGNPHQVALYFLDWDNRARVQSITIQDPVSNAVLDSRSVSSFQNGVYDVWNITGHVIITVTFTGATASSAVVSGLFFDPANTNTPNTPTGLSATSW